MLILRSSLLLLFILVTGTFFEATAQETVPESSVQGYRIGPGDEITGKVLGEPQFDFVSTVDEDGRISVPFVDDPVTARCLTERELRTEVNKLLSRYLRNPQTNIRVTQRNSRPPVSIYGEVKQQGQVPLTRRAYLLELITYAGGPTEKSGGSIQVFRTRPQVCPGEATETWADSGVAVPSKTYSLTSMRQGVEGSNPEILPGDVIIVEKASPVYITGEVLRPGEFSIPEGGLPLMQAISMASGLTREARSKKINIYRRKEGSVEPEVIEVDYNAIKNGEQKEVLLKPHDIVDVGKAKKSFMDVLYEAAIGLPNRVPLPVMRPF
ncbi:MAG: SLBB domain-containing protein [Acidobacteria bacterium]|nr:SLBB domain-containing protein [Acidobacteriota bacterium]